MPHHFTDLFELVRSQGKGHKALDISHGELKSHRFPPGPSVVFVNNQHGCLYCRLQVENVRQLCRCNVKKTLVERRLCRVKRIHIEFRAAWVRLWR